LSKLSLMFSSTRTWIIAFFDCFGGAFRIDNRFLLSPHKLSDSVSDKLFAPLLHVDKTLPRAVRGARERPHELFGRLKAEKVGSLPPDLAFCPQHLFSSPCFPFLCRTRTSLRHRVKKVARKKVQSVISTFFTLSRGFVVGCDDPPKDLHSKIHDITAVVALPFRGRAPTPIAQPRYPQMLELLPQDLPVRRPWFFTGYSGGPTLVVGH
jgi:hypothetical protein